MVTDSGSSTACDGSDRAVLRFVKPSPVGVGVDLYLVEEGDFFPGGTGPVSCLGNDLESATAPGTPISITAPVVTLALGEVAYYVVACHQCGGLIGSGISRLSGVDTERLLGPACADCP